MCKPLFSLNIKGQLKEYSLPVVMGILNVTPDSFFAGSRISGSQAAEEAVRMLSEGAEIIDVGACSTRPGSVPPSATEEWDRLAPALESIREALPEAAISVDTFRADVARKSVELFNVDIINDVGGSRLDQDMLPAVAELGVAYVAMHMRGTPETMTDFSSYDDVAAEVLEALARLIDEAHSRGIADVIADPGFGFAKSADQNFRLLADIEAFRVLECPLLVGVSRKGMIWKTLGVSPEEALNGTSVINTMALERGAAILRVHDVRAAREAVELYSKMPAGCGTKALHKF